MLMQENVKFEKILSMERDHGDKKRLGYNSNVNHTSSIQKTKNVFVNANGKAIVQASHKDKEKV